MGCCEDSLFRGSRSWWKGAKELPTQICKASLTLALEKDHRSPQNHTPVGAAKGRSGERADPYCWEEPCPGTQPIRCSQLSPEPLLSVGTVRLRMASAGQGHML